MDGVWKLEAKAEEVREWCTNNLTGYWQVDVQHQGSYTGHEEPQRVYVTIETTEDNDAFKVRWLSRVFVDAETLGESALNPHDFRNILNEDHSKVFTVARANSSVYDRDWTEKDKIAAKKVIDWCEENLSGCYAVDPVWFGMHAVNIHIPAHEDCILFKLRWLGDPTVGVRPKKPPTVAWKDHI